MLIYTHSSILSQSFILCWIKRKKLSLSICCQTCLLETDNMQNCRGSTMSILRNVCVRMCVYLNWALLGLGDRVWLCCSFSCLSLSILSASRKYVAVMWLYWFDSRALRRWREKSRTHTSRRLAPNPDRESKRSDWGGDLIWHGNSSELTASWLLMKIKLLTTLN